MSDFRFKSTQVTGPVVVRLAGMANERERERELKSSQVTHGAFTLRFEGAPSGGFTATVCPPPDVSGPPSNEMFGRTPYERPRFARSTRSFIILTNGAHSSESWPTNFGEFDPDGANLQSSCAARKPSPFIISGSDRRKPEVNRSSWKRKRWPSSFASSRIHEGARALHTILLDADDEAQSGGALTCRW